MTEAVYAPNATDLNGMLLLKGGSVGPRVWGEETLLLAKPGKYSLKILKYNPNFSGNLQKHWLKDESGIVLEGELIVTYDTGDGELAEISLKPGDAYNFPPGVVHRETAGAEGCKLIEVSTCYFNDRIRCEKEYGLPESDGLPSSELHEITVVPASE